MKNRNDMKMQKFAIFVKKKKIENKHAKDKKYCKVSHYAGK